MSWIFLSENPNSITSLYSKLPKLQDVRLVECKLHQDGPRIELKLDLKNYPEKPPIRWNEKNNAIQVKIVFYDICKFEAKGWGRENYVDVDIFEKLSKEKEVKLSNKALSISFISGFFLIESVNSYLKE